MVRNLRHRRPQDINRLARQLNRTEDKLELLLQEIENLQDELSAQRALQRQQPVAARGGPKQTS